MNSFFSEVSKWRIRGWKNISGTAIYRSEKKTPKVSAAKELSIQKFSK
jgi:hypothetical protein